MSRCEEPLERNEKYRLRDWEKAWLHWARPIVRTSVDNVEHFLWCRERLGEAEYPVALDSMFPNLHPADDPSLRWPGYVGRLWKPGSGILFVGSVHSDFAKGSSMESESSRSYLVAKLANSNRIWRDESNPGPSHDSSYLQETRDAYTALAPGWTRSGVLHDILERLMPDFDPVARFEHAAWTNLAHCRARPGKTNEYTLQLKCSARDGMFPIGQLITAIWPAAIVVSVSPVETTYRFRKRYEWISDPPLLRRPNNMRDPLFRAFDGSTRPSGGFSRGEPPHEWIPDFVSQIRERLLSRESL